MGEKPGFGFRPYDEELVGYYLRHKIEGNDSLVDGVIRETKICSLDPWNLRFQSKIKSRDVVWYFLSCIEKNGSRQSRRTPSGFWKLTGVHVDVNDRWGHVSGTRGKKIGHKRVLTFHSGNLESVSSSNSSIDKNKSDWVMHELHYTLLPQDNRTYVICRLEYKGDDLNILSADPTFAPTMANSASSVIDQSFQGNSGYYNTLSEYDSAYQFHGNYDTQQSFQGYSEYLNPTSEYDLPNQSHWFSNLQVPYSAPYQAGPDLLKQVVEENWSSLLDERTFTREDSSHYRPKNPLTGVFSDDSGDTDTDSMIGRDAWSSTDSVGSKDGPYHTLKYDTPPLNTVEPLHNHEQPKQLELQLQGKEKGINKQKSQCEWKMAEDSIKKAPSTTAVKQSWIVLVEISQRNSQWIYLKNIIIGFLLFIFIIGWIILVG